MRLFQRALRRARLPVRWSCGFNPRPRIAFPLALSVGMEGAREPMDVVLDNPVAPAAIQDALASQVPDGIGILSVEQIAPDACCQAAGVGYRIQLPPGAAVSDHQVAGLLARDRIDVTRGRDRARRVNIRPSVLGISASEATPHGSQTLAVDLAVTAQGTAKPSEILALLNVAAHPGETAPSITRTCVHLASSPTHEEEG